MNSISKERFDEILREEIVRVKNNTAFFETITKLDECKNKKEIKKVLNESNLTEAQLNEFFGGDALGNIWKVITGGGDLELGGVFKNMRDTWKQSFIEWILGQIGFDVGPLRSIIAQVLQNNSWQELKELYDNPSCELLMPTVTKVVAEEIGEEIVAALVNVSPDHIPIISWFISTNPNASYTTFNGFIGRTVFGVPGEALGDTISEHELFKTVITENATLVCNKILEGMEGFSFTSAFNPFSSDADIA